MKGKQLRLVWFLLPCIVVWLTMWTWDHVAAEDRSYLFSGVSSSNGLSQNTVQGILQDHRGFMWFGTQDGLNRYDGNHFTVYKHNSADPSSISNGNITALHEDKAGRLWVGTMQGGLSRFDQTTDNFVNYQQQDGQPTSLPHNMVRAILSDSKDQLWIGTGQGLCRWDETTDTFIPYLTTRINGVVRTLAEDANGYLWVGTEQGLYCLRIDSDEMTKYIQQENSDNTLVDNRIQTLLVSRKGQIWIGTANGLDVLEPTTGTFTHFRQFPNDQSNKSLTGNVITALWEDATGALWVGTIDGGLSILGEDAIFHNYHSNPFDLTSLRDEQIRSIYEDGTGRMWIGTLVGGVNVVDPYQHKFPLVRAVPNDPGTLVNSVIRSFALDYTGTLWVATNGGMSRWQESTKKFIHYRQQKEQEDSLYSNHLRQAYVDNNGRLWTGSTRGINYYDRDQDVFQRFHLPPEIDKVADEELRGVFMDRQSNLWLTSGMGLVRQRPTGEWLHYPGLQGEKGPISSQTRWLYEDQAGYLWVATMAGTSRFDPKTETFRHYLHSPNDNSSIGANVVLSFYEDGNFLWMGTQGGGLCRYDKTLENFTNITIEQGLISDVVYGILPDGLGYLWLSTNQGLIRYQPETGVFRNYAVADGLQHSEFNTGAYFRNPQGELFFGGVNGFNRFKPEQIQDNPHIPPIVFTGFQVDYQPLIKPGKLMEEGVINLPYTKKRLSLEFAALDYTAPENNIYRYQLEGYDSGWSTVGNTRHATYTNLNPGSYIFHVQGANGDGIWNREGASIRIEVEPPPWRTNGAYFLYVVVSGTTIIILSRHRTTRQQRKQEKMTRQKMALEQEVRQRTQELEDANQQLLFISQHDALTGLLNRTGFNTGLLEYTQPRYIPLAVIIGDLDGLKQINDKLGHLYGDQLLQAAGHLIRQAFREGDLVARIGGDEFAIVLPKTREETVALLLEKVAVLINAHNESGEIRVSISFGSAVAHQAPFNMDELFTLADDRMYQVKQEHQDMTLRAIAEYIKKVQYAKK